MAVRLDNEKGRWELPEGELKIGRHLDCQICLDDPRLSRFHAQINVQQDGAVICDLGSSNGVEVNGARIQGDTELGNGDVILIGPIEFVVRIDASQPCAQNLYVLYEAPTRPDSELEFRPSTERRMRTDDEEDEEENEPTVPTLDALAPPGSFDATPLHNPIRSRRDPDPSTDELRPGSNFSPHTDPLLHVRPSQALQHELGRIRQRRMAAGLLDVLQSQLLGLAGLIPFAALGYGLALRHADAGLIDGVPRLGVGGAGTWELSMSFLGSPGAIGDSIADLASADIVGLVICFSGIGMGLMLWFVVQLLCLVLPTVRSSGPLWHRVFDLQIRDHHSGRELSFGRSMLRWCLVVLIGIAAIPWVLLARRAPHDLACQGFVSRRSSETPRLATDPSSTFQAQQAQKHQDAGSAAAEQL